MLRHGYNVYARLIQPRLGCTSFFALVVDSYLGVLEAAWSCEPNNRDDKAFRLESQRKLDIVLLSLSLSSRELEYFQRHNDTMLRKIASNLSKLS